MFFLVKILRTDLIQFFHFKYEENQAWRGESFAKRSSMLEAEQESEDLNFLTTQFWAFTTLPLLTVAGSCSNIPYREQDLSFWKMF